MCFIVNDLTNRELIRRKFKFEEFQIKKDRSDYDTLTDNNINDDFEDIFQGSEIFNNQPENKHQDHETKDLTDIALLQKNKRRQFFSSISF